MRVKFHNKVYKIDMYIEVVPNPYIKDAIMRVIKPKNIELRRCTWHFNDNTSISKLMKNIYNGLPKTTFKYIILDNDCVIRKADNEEEGWELFDDFMTSNFSELVKEIREII